tara:strand:- start:13811 stop:13936 length:126 start_codon:yes stop_codon:yes gene_type:complete
MAEFVCKNCNYRFKSEKIKEVCPYCGKKELIKEPSAEDLLK